MFGIFSVGDSCAVVATQNMKQIRWSQSNISMRVESLVNLSNARDEDMCGPNHLDKAGAQAVNACGQHRAQHKVGQDGHQVQAGRLG